MVTVINTAEGAERWLLASGQVVLLKLCVWMVDGHAALDVPRTPTAESMESRQSETPRAWNSLLAVGTGGREALQRHFKLL